MEIKIKELEDCKREFEAILQYDELIPHFEKALKKYRKNVTIPGFRKGKAPINMIKKLYWDSIEYYSLEDIANDIFRDSIIEREIKIVGTGTITDLDYKPKEMYKFKVEYEILPEIILENYKNIKLSKKKFIIDKSIIDEEIDYIKFKNADFELDGYAADDNYMVTVDTQEIDDEGNPIIGKSDKDVRFFIGSPYLSKEYKQGIQGLKENEERIIETKNSENQIVKIKISCKKVEKIIFPELNSDNIKKFTGREDLNTEEELRNFLSDEILKSYSEQEDEKLKNQLINEVIKLNPFPLPERYVEAILKDLYEDYKKQHQGHKHEKEITGEEFKNLNRSNAILSGKWYLIKKKLIEIENISVNDDDIKNYADKIASAYNIPSDKLFELYKNNKEISETILSDKVTDLLLGYAQIEEVEEVKKSILEKAKEKNK